MPLVNEVVIGLKDKDAFNASEPKDDLQFVDYVTHPTLPALIQLLFGVPAPEPPRADLAVCYCCSAPFAQRFERMPGGEMMGVLVMEQAGLKPLEAERLTFGSPETLIGDDERFPADIHDHANPER